MSSTKTDLVRIAEFRVENFKRVQAVEVVPNDTGLTAIGGNSGEGKTTLLHAIMSTLLGERYTPTNAVHDGAAGGRNFVRLTNGVEVTRTYTPKGTYLTVKDPAGRDAGQQLLNSLLSELALNISKFMRAPDKDKAETLLKILGIDTKPLEAKIAKLEQERLLKGREHVRAKGHAESLPYWEHVGNTPMDGGQLVAELEKGLQHNAQIRQAQQNADANRARLTACRQRCAAMMRELTDLQARLKAAESEAVNLQTACDQADQANAGLQPTDTTTLQAKMADLDAHNAKTRDNASREQAYAEVEAFAAEYSDLDLQVTAARAELTALINGADLPLPTLTIEDGALRYRGKAWDCMGGAEQRQVAVAICRRINPRCGFVLVDGLEAMDLKTMREFSAYLKSQGLQAIGTRVSTGPECTLIIEDGRIAGGVTEEPEATTAEEPSFA